MATWQYSKNFDEWYWIACGGTQRFEVFSEAEAADITAELNAQAERIAELEAALKAIGQFKHNDWLRWRRLTPSQHKNKAMEAIINMRRVANRAADVTLIDGVEAPDEINYDGDTEPLVQPLDSSAQAEGEGA